MERSRAGQLSECRWDQPVAGLIFDRVGNLYGTTDGFGGVSFGNVFKLTPNADGMWTETVLHSFDDTDGDSPQAPVAFDPGWQPVRCDIQRWLIWRPSSGSFAAITGELGKLAP